jgi:hypothetical protein
MKGQPEIYDQIRKVNGMQLTLCNDEQNVMDLCNNECAVSSHVKLPFLIIKKDS